MQSWTKEIRGTVGSTGWDDGRFRIMKFQPEKEKIMLPGGTDQEDIDDVVAGRIQGIMRGSFVCRSIVAKYPNILGMAEPWDIEESLVLKDGECFAYPCHIESGLGVTLSSFLTQSWITGYLKQKAREYNMADTQ